MFLCMSIRQGIVALAMGLPTLQWVQLDGTDLVQSASCEGYCAAQRVMLATGQESAGLLQRPWVLATAAKLIGNYSLWFGALGGEEVPLTGALQLLLQALPVPEVMKRKRKHYTFQA